jgi:hypothetical protein
MAAKVRSLQEYIKELERSKKDKPDQVREALEIYLNLWRKAMENGVVGAGDEMEVAMEKIERSGGLYQAAGES